jgi:hypothetical protein
MDLTLISKHKFPPIGEEWAQYPSSFLGEIFMYINYPPNPPKNFVQVLYDFEHSVLKHFKQEG